MAAYASEIHSTRLPEIGHIGLSSDRIMNGRRAVLPPGTVLVSADTHWFIKEDIFFERAPEHIRHRMPRVWRDEENGIFLMGVNHQRFLTSIFNKIIPSLERPGAFDLDARLADLDNDGVAMEIAFPQWLLFYLHQPDLEAREWIFRIYNDYLAELQARSGGRFFGVGIPNYWDPAKSADSIRHIKEIGLKTYMLPMTPGKNVEGKPILYASMEMDPLWQAAEEAGLPINYHVGENASAALEEPGGIGTVVLSTFMPFRRNMGELMFGGVFDRHPTLRIVFAEANINWIPGMLQDAEMACDGWGKLLQPKLERRPTEYWQRHCYATIMSDKVGLGLIDYIGADRVMWSNDYPHNEGTHGYTAEIIEQILGAVPADQAKAILGGTAMQLYDLA